MRDHPEIFPEEAEEDEFYESLERILSSSGSSTSTSDDDGEYRSHCGGGCGIGGHHYRRRGSALYLPPPAWSYDVWISEPSSVEERRRRLLQQMGLIDDPALSRGRAAVHNDVNASSGCSRSRDPFPTPSTVAGFGRSRSDGTVDPDRMYKEHVQRRAISFGSGTVDLPGGADGRGFSFSLGLVADSDGDGSDRACTIKNLDDGSEFVVKEIREDGMWNKLREVGTGRQLTMEEFEMCVGRSPIVQELMRRQNVEDSVSAGSRKDGAHGSSLKSSSGSLTSVKPKKKASWLRSIKNMAGTVVATGHHRKEKRSSDEKDTSSEKGGRRSSSATDDSLDGSHFLHHGPERIKVRQYGKLYKELSGLYITQEIHAHKGSIWSIRFSLDGRYLASSGEDCIIHVWEVVEFERKGELSEGSPGENGNGNCYPFLAAISSGSPELPVTLGCVEGSQWEKKKRAKAPNNRRPLSSDHLMAPEHIFALSEKPVCSFSGHKQDVLDLSWSKSQYLLSSSMDKTVRLWHMSSTSCLKTFTHSDYVTCIQFNPVDDRYFISGSLDEKLRLWSIPGRQVVDWNDIHEMVTAVCFTPDGKGALLGTHKGSCHLFDASENKLHHRSQINLQAKKGKSSHKKITGFQFAPGSSSEVLITSADSRIRVVNGIELVHKFKGFRNSSSQISASFSPNGKYAICASEDSHVYMWRYDADSQPSRTKGVVNTTQSYEHFHCQDVTVAAVWPGITSSALITGHCRGQNSLDANHESVSAASKETNNTADASCLPIFRRTGSPHNGSVLANINSFADEASTWPEENFSVKAFSRQNSGDSFNEAMNAECRSAWGMAIVTAGSGGEIRTYQNFGFPLRL